MRTYRISYYAEHKDNCNDFELEIQADGVYDALNKFTCDNIYKRIYKVEELPTMTLERRIELKVNEGNDVWIPYAQISQSLRDFWIEYFKK